MRREEPRLLKAGLGVVLIGMGTPEEALDFQRRLKLPFPVLSDPSTSSYALLGLGHIQRSQEASLGNLVSTISAGVRYGGGVSQHQDMTQLGGACLIGQDGVVRYVYRTQRMSDLVPLDALIAAI